MILWIDRDPIPKALTILYLLRISLLVISFRKGRVSQSSNTIFLTRKKFSFHLVSLKCFFGIRLKTSEQYLKPK